MFKKAFDIDYSKLALLMLPPDLRRGHIINILFSSIMPVRWIYGEFLNQRQNHIYKLMHNGQICYLRKALNDSFDPSLRRIQISDGSNAIRTYIYTNAEKQPRYLGVMYLRNATDFQGAKIDFKVILPKAYPLKSVEAQMKALIDFYKLASKRYKIEIADE